MVKMELTKQYDWFMEQIITSPAYPYVCFLVIVISIICLYIGIKNKE